MTEMKTPSANLPIASVLEPLRQQLAASATVILQADPGAGKSTVVPLALLDAPWLAGQKILLLQPRRIAARAVAARMAATLGERIGDTVGYRMRLERRVGRKTRIEVVTEGMLTRQLQADPLLDGVGCIIFDEFHERSLQADLGLALARDVQQSLRDDLRILLMSATMESDALSALLDDAPVIRSEGRSHPVTTRYSPAGNDAAPSPARIAHVTREALERHDGSVLVFLPGIGEIRQVEAALAPGLDERTLLTPLYGGLDLRQQTRAIAPAPPGQRKVVLATAIAETSLTIDGISIVVDAGLERRAETDPRSGMSRLVTVPASRASADQRRGRAGRLGPGHCYRLWSEAEQSRRPAHSPPEIELTDLAPLALELFAWGVGDPASLTWLTPPPAQRWQQALRLLRMLEAIDDGDRLTAHGKGLVEFGLHPRLAHMIVRAAEAGAGRQACAIAAFMQERSPFRGSGAEPDFTARLALLDHERNMDGVDRGLLHRVRQQARALQGRLGQYEQANGLSPGAICALAYPDRIGQRRGGVRPVWRLSGGGAAFFPGPNAISDEPFLVITELDGRAREARIFAAAPISRDEIEELFAERIETTEETLWDEQQQKVVAMRQRRFGELVLEETAIAAADPEKSKTLLIDAIRKRGIDCLPWTKASEQWRRRVQFLAGIETLELALPDLSPHSLTASLEQWLAPWLDGMNSLADLQRLDMLAILRASVDWETSRQIDELAPTHLVVPSGSRLPLDYEAGEAPVLEVRLQEMYSATTTPTVAGGRVRVRLHLLSPARRPVQITDDIAGFWSGSYAEVRKEMKGRYPKHHWPEDPVTARPHHGVRPKPEKG